MLKKREEVKERSAVKESDKWDVESLFASFDEARAALDKIRKIAGDNGHFETLAYFKGRLANPANLKQYLDTFYDIQRKLIKVYTYGHLRLDEDITNRIAKELFELTTLTYTQLIAATSWATPEILRLEDDKFEALISDPSLREYEHVFRKLKHDKPFTLSEKEERILALSADATGSIKKAFGAMDNADLKFKDCENEKGEKLPLSHALYGLYMQSKDRKLRKTAFENMHHEYLAHENTFSELLGGQVKVHQLSAKARGYDSCMHAALSSNEVDTKVYTNLLEGVKERLSSLHKYIAHRKKVLGVDKLYAYDLQVPLSQEMTKRYSYSEAEKLVLDSLTPLGENYIKIAQSGLQKQRWVDRYENKNKRSGAYSSGCFDSHPYILMNFNGSLRDVFTLTHELGHSMHSYFSNTQRRYVDSSYCIFVAEVASTFNEMMLFNHLVEKAQAPEEKKYLLYSHLDNIRATLFRQTLFADFELQIHQLWEQGRPLSPGLLKDVYSELSKTYYGPEFTVDESLSAECFRIPHFYYGFYVYQYATGISAALSLYNSVSEGGQSAREKYLAFLGSGSTSDPVTLLENAGVSMRTKEPIYAMIDYFDKILKLAEAAD